MKYIDADRLKVEIEKHIKEVKDAAERFTPNIGFFDAKLSGIYDVMAIIDSLPEEKPSEDFPTSNEEMAKFSATHPKVEVPEKYKTPNWLFDKQPSEDLEGKQMIKELKERIVGLDNNGNPIAAAPPDIPMIVEKVNEIIRYINEREGDHFREPTKTMEEEALSWAGSSAVDAFKAGVEWLKEQDATQRE